jgi:hypothetical protein
MSIETNGSDLITDLQISEINSDGTATISFLPVAGIYGTAEITFRLSDDAGNTISRKIRVHAKNYSIDQVEDQDVDNQMRWQNIPISGIGDGSGATDQLTVSVSTDRPDLVEGLQIGEISPEGVAALRYKPSKTEQGTALVTVIVADEVNKITMSFNVTVTNPTTSMRESDQPLFVLYPNPSNGHLTIQFLNGVYGKYVISDSAGRIVKQGNIELCSAPVQLDLTYREDGIYFIAASLEELVDTQKIILSK